MLKNQLYVNENKVENENEDENENIERFLKPPFVHSQFTIHNSRFTIHDSQFTILLLSTYQHINISTYHHLIFRSARRMAKMAIGIVIIITKISIGTLSITGFISSS